jgi:integrase
VDVKSLSEILGHADVSITLNTYVHSSMEQKRSQMERLSAIRGQNSGHEIAQSPMVQGVAA